MKKVTLCFLSKDDSICLGMKKRGFGVGKWNGFGGKLEEGETLEQAAIRELKEESGVDAREEHLEPVGDIEFYFDDRPEWNLHVHIFKLVTWEGEPTESDEMLPQWYAHHEIPYEDMWVDDPLWLPDMLEGRKVQGKVFLVNEGKNIREHDFKVF